MAGVFTRQHNNRIYGLKGIKTLRKFLNRFTFPAMIKIPPYLKKGDTIGLLCPAGYMPMEKVSTCIQTLQDWGYQVRVGKTVGSSSETYFSGTDEERLSDLQEMMDDDSIHAILCARGGYGTGRIIDRIDFKKFKKKSKMDSGL